MDPELTQYFDGDTSGMEGALKLYARWLESPVGQYAMYTVTGECDRGMSSYTLEGSQTKIFYYCSPWTGMLCTWMIGSNTCTYTEAHEKYDKFVNIMQETPGYSNCRYMGTETIDTTVGKKVCEVYTTTYDDGAVGTVWIEGCIPYKETYDFISDNDSSIEREHIEYLYESGGEVEIPQEGTLALYTEKVVKLLIDEYNAKNAVFDGEDYLNYLLAFTQYIPYQTDEEYLGYLEYWKFPLETLFDNGGDCEDTSILFVAIAHESIKKLGLDCEVALQVLPRHVSVAVKTESISGETNPYGYLYGETTAKNYKIGNIPDIMKDCFLKEDYYTLRSYTVEIH